LTLALAAHDLGDRKLFQRATTDLRNAWPSAHVISCLLDGLGRDMAGEKAAAKRAFVGYLKKLQAPGSSLPPWERRSVSVNLYHMARILAQAGDKTAAMELLNEADRLNPGKKTVATKDPAFR